MVFTSFNFILFFPLVIVLYYLTPKRRRWITLLVLSWFFYLNFKPIFIVYVIILTILTYVFTRLIESCNSDSLRNRYKLLGVISVFTPLFIFKYYTPINNIIIDFLINYNIRVDLPNIELLLPIGISYYTFMALSYIIDVYNEEVNAEKNIGLVALFLSFFPLILSGPIERAKNMIPQFIDAKSPNYSMISSGFKLIVWGYFMKLVIADRIGLYTDVVFNNIDFHSGSTLLLATFLYPIQVYGDLGGYSLLAIGVSKVLGLNVQKNFNRPFFSKSMSEFWRRWHMSLILWLTDYIYTPLTFYFRSYKKKGVMISLLITFILSGLWHEATLGFFIWGLLQGLFLIFEVLVNKKRLALVKKFRLENSMLYSILGMVTTYILFSVSELFSRVTNLSETFLIIGKIFSFNNFNIYYGESTNIIFAFFGVSLLFVKEVSEEFYSGKALLFNNKYKIIRVLSFTLTILLIILMGVLDNSQFIYFQY